MQQNTIKTSFAKIKKIILSIVKALFEIREEQEALKARVKSLEQKMNELAIERMKEATK